MTVKPMLQSIVPALLALAAVSGAALGQPVAQGNVAPFLGRWTGTMPIQDQHFHATHYVDLEIRSNPFGTLELIDLSPEAGGPNERELIVIGDQIRTKTDTQDSAGPHLPPWSAKLTADGALAVQPASGAGGEPLRLSHSAALAAKLDVPRLDNNGKRIVQYSYSQPSGEGEWQTEALTEASLDSNVVRDVMESVFAQQRTSQNHTDAILLARNGKLVLEEYFWNYDRDAPHQISSVTKSITSMVTGAAIDQGKIRLSDKVAGYFTTYPTTAWLKQSYPITLRDLLTMRAGLEWQEDVPYADARNSTIAMRQSPNALTFVLDRPLTSPPGSKYNYNSGLPKLVGAMVQQAIGKPIDAFADQAIFHPLGITNYTWTRQRDGAIETAGGMWMRPRDMLKLGQLMLNGGSWNDQAILSKQWVSASTSQQTAPDDYPYGYFWHIFTPSHPIAGRTGFMAIGQGGQLILVLPDSKTVLVVVSSNWGPGGSKIALDGIASNLLKAVR